MRTVKLKGAGPFAGIVCYGTVLNADPFDFGVLLTLDAGYQLGDKHVDHVTVDCASGATLTWAGNCDIFTVTDVSDLEYLRSYYTAVRGENADLVRLGLGADQMNGTWGRALEVLDSRGVDPNSALARATDNVLQLHRVDLDGPDEELAQFAQRHDVAVLEKPAQFADRDDVWGLLYPALTGSAARDVAAKIVHARDKHNAAKCRDLAGAAEREASRHADTARVDYCDGQASAFRAMAALLEAT